MRAAFKFMKCLKLRQKLFLSYAAVVMIPLLVLGYFSYRMSNAYLLQLEQKNLTENVEKIASNLNYKFNRFNSVMEFVTMNPRFIEIFSKNYTDPFLMYKDISGVVVPVLNTIQGLDGDIRDIAVCTNNDFPELSGSIKRTENMQGEFWADFECGITQTNWYIDSGRLVGIRKLMADYKSTYDSTFMLELDYDNMFSDISLVKLREYEALLVDAKGCVIYRKSGLPEEKPPKGNGVMKLEAELPAANWKLYFYIPVDSITINAEKMILTILLITGICLLVLLVLVWLFSGVFLKRINELNRKMKIVEGGNLQIDIHSDSKDEIGDLINGAGSMLRSINRLMEEVYLRGLKQKEAQIKLLQSQINPHFLYNSLSMINWKAIKIKATDISYIITTLSKYYRTTLNKGKNYATVKDETDNIISYINIQLMMHNGRFDAEYHIDPSINNFYMPNLTLQPIVENAIEHGVDKKETGRGKITVTAGVKEGGICFAVEDNGPGMSEEVLGKALTQQSGGYGIKNVDDRIKLIFGEEYGLIIESRIMQGTRVEVRIPTQINPPECTITTV